MTTELLAHMTDYFLGRTTGEDMWSPDVVIESPFARPGRPKMYTGRAEFLEATRAEREAMPVRFDEFRATAVHQTTDPEVVVVEYVFGGTVLPTGHHASAPFIAVARVRDGKVVHWREYQDTAAIDAALSGEGSS